MLTVSIRHTSAREDKKLFPRRADPPSPAGTHHVYATRTQSHLLLAVQMQQQPLVCRLCGGAVVTISRISAWATFFIAVPDELFLDAAQIKESVC